VELVHYQRKAIFFGSCSTSVQWLGWGQPGVHQCGGPFLDKIQYGFKTVALAVVGIGERLIAEKQRELVLLLWRALPSECGKIQLVRSEDEIETQEVRLADLARAQTVQLVAAPTRVADGARVRSRTDVIIFRACRIDLNCELGLCEGATQHRFRCGRAADVAHANDEHLGGDEWR